MDKKMVEAVIDILTTCKSSRKVEEMLERKGNRKESPFARGVGSNDDAEHGSRAQIVGKKVWMDVMKVWLYSSSNGDAVENANVVLLSIQGGFKKVTMQIRQGLEKLSGEEIALWFFFAVVASEHCMDYGYHMDVRPVNNHSEVMDINISIGLYNIQEVDIVKGVLTVSISTFVSWFDQRMVWKPAEFGGITKIRISMKEVWTPPITLLNPVEFTTMAHFRLKLKRQSLFYILTVILPVVGIGSLAGIVFLLPSESGERVSFTFTILVALAVFLTVVEDHLPKSSEPVSLMCTFVLIGILTNCAGCVFVVLNLAIFHRDESVPKMKWHTSISQCKRKNRDIYTIRMEQSEEFRPSQSNEVIKTKPIKVKETEVNGDEVVTWRDVSKAIDRVMMYIMIIVGSVPVPILMIYISALSEYPET
ncbi:uncharacterized protein LOC128549371 [Mercenaria mercenaria]|uniref:uncharacterized protein LOC128549371 n=1 Tax=Mercenaria mercenaria TaxID=6596 RepID=UPI00234F7A3D|nr:uncharacterized protein LOC128549371 [Mercenaria mercenaria]